MMETAVYQIVSSLSQVVGSLARYFIAFLKVKCGHETKFLSMEYDK